MTVQMKGGHSAEDPRLGRVPPKDWRHVERYPLLALPVEERPTVVPVGIGVNWYRAFYADQLIKRRGKFGITEYWVREGDLGRIMGGHAITLEPFTGKAQDTHRWWLWHDQISEGICVSEMVVRMGAMLERKRFQPRPVYDAAQKIDYWPGEAYDGTSVDAGLRVWRDRGLVPAKWGEQHVVHRGVIARDFDPQYAIKANRWARTDQEVFDALGRPDGEFAEWLNSWGRKAYPWRVKVPRSVIARLLHEYGEMGIVTPR